MLWGCVFRERPIQYIFPFIAKTADCYWGNAQQNQMMIIVSYRVLCCPCKNMSFGQKNKSSLGGWTTTATATTATKSDKQRNNIQFAIYGKKRWCCWYNDDGKEEKTKKTKTKKKEIGKKRRRVIIIIMILWLILPWWNAFKWWRWW